MKKISLFLATILSMALLTVPAVAVSDGDVSEADVYAAASDEFVESPSRGDDPVPEPDVPEPNGPDIPSSPQTGADQEATALWAVAFGVGAVGILIAGRKKEKAS